MSRLRTNLITNRMANGAPTVSNGLVISGITTTSEILVGNTIKLDPVAGIVTSPAVDVNNFLNVGSNIKLGNAGIITATTFVGDLTGNVTGNVAGNVTGNADTASGLSGNASINTTGIVTATAFVPTSQGALSHRNLIINGQFMIWQRATDSGSNTTDGYLSCDRWYHASSGATKQVTRQAFTPGQTDVPDNPKYYLRYAVTTGNNNVALRQRIEDITRVQGEMTFSFWVKGTNPGGGNFNLTFRQNFGAGGSASNVVDSGISDYTVSNTWTKKTFTFTPASISGKTIGTTETTSYYEIELFRQPAGDTSTAAFTVDFANVQLERGSVSTSFEQRSYGDELASCQRYYYMHHNTSKTGTEGNYRVACLGFASQATEVTGHIFFPVTMRANPTLDANSGVVGGIGYWRIGGGVHGGDKYIDGAWTISSPTTRSTRIYATPRVSLTNGATGYIDGRNNASYMAFSAEL